jgi:DNA primase
MVEAGLVAKDGAGNVRDRFRGRVMFPIHDLSGNAVGFGGRLLEGPHAPTDAPKYVNSADSPVYHKGSLLYNLHRAKAEVTRTGRAWMVEGYTDVIALDQAGVQAVVATCGTALGEDHLRLLARFTERLVLAFDSDEAGARAAERAFQFHERYPLDVSVLVLPQGQDPADFALAQGEGAAEAFTALESEAVPLVVYMLERSLSGRPLDDVEAQTRAVQDGGTGWRSWLGSTIRCGANGTGGPWRTGSGFASSPSCSSSSGTTDGRGRRPARTSRPPHAWGPGGAPGRRWSGRS